ncbi:MAG TPA: hypothetical protein VF814_15150 [Casimicrobiaceae bacterium]
MARPVSPRALRMRLRIAQAAARLIAEHGLSDWRAAKRKACRELGLPEDESLPANDEVEQALRDYNNLFHAATQPISLRAQRREAMRWMERFSRWDPVLTGAVAAGWATEHSEIRLELEAEDAKAVELALVNAGVAYAQAPTPSGEAQAPQLRIESPETTVRLVILSPQQRRNRPRRDRPGLTEERLTLPQLKTLLATEDESPATHAATPRPPERSR